MDLMKFAKGRLARHAPKQKMKLKTKARKKGTEALRSRRPTVGARFLGVNPRDIQQIGHLFDGIEYCKFINDLVISLNSYQAYWTVTISTRKLILRKQFMKME